MFFFTKKNFLIDFLDNQISKIQGLKNCYRLQHLSLAHNRISQIEELEGLPLKYLNLVWRKILFSKKKKRKNFFDFFSKRSNQIRNIENLDSLQYLQQLNLSCNQLENLTGFPERLNFLEVLDLADNQVKIQFIIINFYIFIINNFSFKIYLILIVLVNFIFYVI